MQEYEKYRRRTCFPTVVVAIVVTCSLEGSIGKGLVFSTANDSFFFYFFICPTELKIKYGEALSDEDEDDTVFSGDEDGEKKTKEPKQAKFKTQTSLTTVTVIEDMDQDDGTFGMPQNNAEVLEKSNKKAKGKNGGEDEDDDEDDEDDAKDKKKEKIGSSSATSAKGAKKLWPAKEKKKKFRKFTLPQSVSSPPTLSLLTANVTSYSYRLTIVPLIQQVTKERFSAGSQPPKTERVAIGRQVDVKSVVVEVDEEEDAVVVGAVAVADSENGPWTPIDDVLLNQKYKYHHLFRIEVA